MTRIYVISIAAAVVLAVGCQEPRRDHAHLLVEPAPPEAVREGFLQPGAGEADYVEQVAATRQAYREALESLVAYYRSVGNYTKGQWAQTELRTYNQMVKYAYLAPAEVAPTNLQARDVIDEAEELYEQAMRLFRQGGGGLPLGDQALQREALGYFNQLIAEYPTSRRIDDAAYRAGQIYERLGNYELAAIYYQRAFQWNAATPYPARYRAARVMDQRLRMRSEALALYKLAVEHESRFTDNIERAQIRIAAMTGAEVE